MVELVYRQQWLELEMERLVHWQMIKSGRRFDLYFNRHTTQFSTGIQL